MNQIDIPDYQYYLGCNAKRWVRLTFIEKKFLFQSEKSTFSLIILYYYYIIIIYYIILSFLATHSIKVLYFVIVLASL